MTLEEIARALELDERTARRDLESALAKLRAGFAEHSPMLIVAVVTHVLRESSPAVSIPRRFSQNPQSNSSRAQCAATKKALSPDAEQRAGHSIPRRFKDLK